MHPAEIKINLVARDWTSPEVLYINGKNGDIKASRLPHTKQVETVKNNNFRSVSFASSILPAPNSCPTIIAMAPPIERNTTLNRFETVLEIFSPATTDSPRTE